MDDGILNVANFSLRTLRIATTLVAVALGLGNWDTAIHNPLPPND